MFVRFIIIVIIFIVDFFPRHNLVIVILLTIFVLLLITSRLLVFHFFFFIDSIFIFFISLIRLVIISTFLFGGLLVIFRLISLVKDAFLDDVGIVIQNLDNLFDHVGWHRWRHQILVGFAVDTTLKDIRVEQTCVILLILVDCLDYWAIVMMMVWVFIWVACRKEVQVLRLASTHFFIGNLSLAMSTTSQSETIDGVLCARFFVLTAIDEIVEIRIEVLDLLTESFNAPCCILAIVIIIRFFTSAIVILFSDLIEHANLPIKLFYTSLISSL